jgi:uncharacterized membrane protein YfcA
MGIGVKNSLPDKAGFGLDSQFGLITMSFGVGILVGLTGMGGAALLTPFLILVVGVKPVLAVGTDLVYGAITKVVGGAVHWRQKTVNLETVRTLAIGSVPGGVAGVALLRALNSSAGGADESVKHWLGVVLIAVAVALLARSFGLLPQVMPAWMERRKRAVTITWGFLVGVAVGLTSVGSGSLMMPFLMMLNPGKPSEAVGTDVVHAAVLLGATATLHGGAGHVDWALVPVLLAGSIPGVLIGSRMAKLVPARELRVGLSALLLMTGVSLY